MLQVGSHGKRLRTWVLRNGKAALGRILAVDLHQSHRERHLAGGRLTGPLNRVRGAVANSGDIEAPDGCVCVFGLEHENVEPLKASQRGRDLRRRAFDARDNARQSRRRYLERDGTRVDRNSAPGGNDRQYLDEIASEGGTRVGGAEGCGRLASVARKRRIGRRRAHEAKFPIQVAPLLQVVDDVPDVVQVADFTARHAYTCSVSAARVPSNGNVPPPAIVISPAIGRNPRLRRS